MQKSWLKKDKTGQHDAEYMSITGRNRMLEDPGCYFFPVQKMHDTLELKSERSHKTLRFLLRVGLQNCWTCLNCFDSRLEKRNSIRGILLWKTKFEVVTFLLGIKREFFPPGETAVMIPYERPLPINGHDILL